MSGIFYSDLYPHGARKWVENHFNKQSAEEIRIQYGGSAKASNAAELLGKKDVDGLLVGGASLKAADFMGIIEAAL